MMVLIICDIDDSDGLPLHVLARHAALDEDCP